VRSLGPAAKVLVPQLQDRLTDPDVRIQCSAATSLFNVGEPRVRVEAAKVLGKLGFDAIGTKRILKEAPKEDETIDADVRKAAAVAYAAIDEADDADAEAGNRRSRDIERSKNVEFLRLCLFGSDHFACHQAAVALARLGPSAQAAVADLRRTLAGDHLGPGSRAARSAADNFEPDSLDYVDMLARGSAAWALGEIGSAAISAVPELRAALGYRWPDIRASAAKAIGKLGPAAKDAVPELRYALSDPASDVRKAAATSLGLLAPAARAAIVDLQQTAQADIRSQGSARRP